MITLRRICKKNLELVRKWRMNPEISEQMITSPIISQDDQIKWYANISKNDNIIFWMIYYEKVPIGIVSIKNEGNGEYTGGHYIGESRYLGKGIMTLVERNVLDYLFDELNGENIYYEVFATNKIAIHMHEKNGFVIIKRISRYIEKDGLETDIVVMNISKEKWYLHKKILDYKKIIIQKKYNRTI